MKESSPSRWIALLGTVLIVVSFATDTDAARRTKRRKGRQSKAQAIQPIEQEDAAKAEDAKARDAKAEKTAGKEPAAGAAASGASSAADAVAAANPGATTTISAMDAEAARHANPAGESPPATPSVDEPTSRSVVETGDTGRAELFPVTVGVEVGSSFSQVLSKLGTSPSVTVEVGYLLPLMEQRLEASLDLSYVRPRHKSKATDPRLPGDGSYVYNLVEEELLLSVGGLYRLLPPATQLNFYGQLAYRLRFQQSNAKGRAGTGFGQNDETATEPAGFWLAGGAEFMLGPGALAAELGFSFGDLDHRTTGNVSVGGLVLQVGYHFLF